MTSLLTCFPTHLTLLHAKCYCLTDLLYLLINSLTFRFTWTKQSDSNTVIAVLWTGINHLMAYQLIFHHHTYSSMYLLTSYHLFSTVI